VRIFRNRRYSKGRWVSGPGTWSLTVEAKPRLPKLYSHPWTVYSMGIPIQGPWLSLIARCMWMRSKVGTMAAHQILLSRYSGRFKCGQSWSDAHFILTRKFKMAGSFNCTLFIQHAYLCKPQDWRYILGGFQANIFFNLSCHHVVIPLFERSIFLSTFNASCYSHSWTDFLSLGFVWTV